MLIFKDQIHQEECLREFRSAIADAFAITQDKHEIVKIVLSRKPWYRNYQDVIESLIHASVA